MVVTVKEFTIGSLGESSDTIGEPMIRIQLKIKFRWMFDIARIDEMIDIPVNGPLPTFDKVVYDRKGVFLRIFTV